MRHELKSQLTKDKNVLKETSTYDITDLWSFEDMVQLIVIPLKYSMMHYHIDLNGQNLFTLM